MRHPALLPNRTPRGVQWPEGPHSCTPQVPPVSVIPLTCPATTALGARTLALRPTDPPESTGTMSACWQAEDEEAARWGNLCHREPTSTSRIWELLPLLQNLAKGGRKEHFWFGTSELHTKTGSETGGGDRGVGEPGSGMLKGHRGHLDPPEMCISFQPSNFPEAPWKFPWPSVQTAPAEMPPLEPAKHKSEPCTNTPENRGLQEILTHFTPFKALINLRSTSCEVGFFFYVCVFPSDITCLYAALQFPF